MRKYLLLLLVNLMVFLALSEVVGLIYFFKTEGTLFYNRSELNKEDISLQRSKAVFSQTPLVIHPILGITQRPGISVDEKISPARLKMLMGEDQLNYIPGILANNLGFFSIYDYPYQKKPDEFVIAIFGGSVAQWFALQGADELKRMLRERFHELKDKRIVVLNLAQGGYKQPQQALLLSYLAVQGQLMDIVVNIDGFNEIALTRSNQKKNVHESFPNAAALLPLVKLIDSNLAQQSELILLAKSASLRTKFERYETASHNARLASVGALLQLYANFVDKEYGHVIEQIDQFQFNTKDQSIVHIQPSSKASNRELVFQWQRSVAQMQAIANLIGAKFISIVQPNQYYTKHEFSDEEKKIAWNSASPYRKPIEEQYPILESSIDVLRESGVTIESAIDIFDLEQRAVFGDSCCHFNQLGNVILAEFIANKIEDHFQVLLAPIQAEAQNNKIQKIGKSVVQ